MKKNILKGCIVLFTVLITLYAGFIIFFRFGFDVNRYAEKLKSDIEAETNTSISWEGLELYPVYSPVLTLSANKLTATNKNINIELQYPEVQINLFNMFIPGKFAKVKVQDLFADFTGENGKFYASENYKNLKSSRFFNELKKVPCLSADKYKVKFIKAGKPFVLEGNSAKSSKKSGKYDNTIKGILYSDNGLKVSYDLGIMSERKIPANFRQNSLFEEIYKLEPVTEFFARLDVVNDKNVSGTAILNKMSFKLNSELLNDNFVYLSFDDNMISVNANLKTSSSGGIKLKGDYTNAKERLLKLDVKSTNADIAAISELIDLFGMNFDKVGKFKNYKLAGKCNTDFYLLTDFQNTISSGTASVKNGAIRNDLKNITLTDINSEIIFDNNVITVKPSEFSANGMKIKFSGITGADSDLKLTGSNIDMQQITPFINDIPLFKNANIKGRADLNLNLTGKPDDIKIAGDIDLISSEIYSNGKKLINADKSKIKFSGNTDFITGHAFFSNAKIVIGTESFKTPELKAELLKDRIVIPQTEFTGGNGKLIANADIEHISEIPYINGRFLLTVPASKISKYSGFNGNSFPSGGTLKVNGDFTGKKGEIKTNISWNTNSENFIEILPVKELKGGILSYSAKITTSGKLVNFENFTVQKAGNKLLSANFTIDNGKIKKSFIKINSPLTFNIKEFNNAEATLKGDFKTGLNNVLESANAQISVLKIPANDITAVNGYLTTESKGIRINFPDVKAGNAKFGIKGFLQSKNNGKFEFKDGKIEGSDFDFETFEKFALENLKGFEMTNTSFRLKSLNFSDFKINNPTGNVKIGNNIAAFTNLNGEYAKGKISGSMNYNIASGEKQLKITGKNVDFNEFSSSLTGRDEKTKGLADFTINVKTFGSTPYAHRKNASGTFDVTIKNGNIGALTDYSNYIQAQNFINQNSFKAALVPAKKQLSAMSANIFQTVKLHGRVQSAALFIDEGTAVGSDITLFITGRINELSGVANINVYGKISDKIRNASGKIASPVDKSIMTSSDDTSVNNLFYDTYYTKINDENIAKIPNLKSCKQIFTAKIDGIPDKIRSVKYLKWQDKD